MNLGRKIEAADFAVPAPAGRSTVQAAVVPPFHFENDFFTVELPVKDGFVQRDETRAITKVALLDRYSGRTRVSRMFWKDVGMKTPDSAMCCSIVHDNHNTWVIGSSDEAMAMAVNAMAEMDGGFVLISEGQVVATRASGNRRPNDRTSGGTIGQRSSGHACGDGEVGLDGKTGPAHPGIPGGRPCHRGALLCVSHLPSLAVDFYAAHDALPEGFVNVRTGEAHPVIW